VAQDFSFKYISLNPADYNTTVNNYLGSNQDEHPVTEKVANGLIMTDKVLGIFPIID
jgi:hypothetical protein